jgi:nitroreductase
VNDLLELIEERQSTRAPFNPKRRVGADALRQILEAGRWAPTPHNMQNFEVIAVDDRKLLKKIGGIKSGISETFLRENYKQFSFSREELLEKRVGVLSTAFPESWRSLDRIKEAVREEASSPLHWSINGSPMLLIVVYNPKKRAPDSEGDVLGFIGLGCVMENMWLMATSLGISMQVLSVFADGHVESEVKRMLKIDKKLKIAFALRLGYPESKKFSYLRVRRDIGMFSHHNQFGNKIE